MKNTLTDKVFVLIPHAVLFIIVIVLLFQTLSNQHGVPCYTIDDPYIHMAIAKNLVRHGVWGLTPYEYTSSSSSPLWVLLLAGSYLIGGVNALSPLLLNITIASLLLCAVFIIYRYYEIPAWYACIVLLLLVYFTSLPGLIFTGMEHTFHILLTIIFASLIATYLTANDIYKRKRLFHYLLIVSPLLTLTRYEGIFIIGVAFVLLILHKEWRASIIMLVAATIPLIIYGFISASHGWYWIPNSILLKGRRIYFNSFRDILPVLNPAYFFSRIFYMADLFIIWISGVTILIIQAEKKWRLCLWRRVLLAIFVFTTMLHIQFADVGWFWRYEAYIVALGIVVLPAVGYEFLTRLLKAKNLSAQLPYYVVLPVMLVLLSSPLIIRGKTILFLTPQTIQNIYEQHYQIGRFLQKYYPGQIVALNDAGAPNYMADIRCVDLWGLASRDVARMKRNRAYDTLQVSELCKSRNAQIAIVYDHWFTCGQIATQGIPSDWIKVGSWRISNRIIVDSASVSFYALKPAEEPRLLSNLTNFVPSLPAGVEIAFGKDSFADDQITSIPLSRAHLF